MWPAGAVECRLLAGREAGANDIFRTMVTQFSLQQGNVFTQGDRYGDNRRIGLNVRYAFGIQKKETRQSMIPNDFD